MRGTGRPIDTLVQSWSNLTVKFFLSVSLLLLTVAFVTAAEKPANLVNEKAWASFEGWSTAGAIAGSAGEKKWKWIKPGKAIIHNTDKKEAKPKDIVSVFEHGDVDLEIEFMIPKSSNSGIYFMKRYEVQILDSYGKPDQNLSFGDCGGLYQRWDDSKPTNKEKGFEGTPPATNASAAPGAWQKFRVQFRAPRFDADGKKIENARFIRVVHNGVTVHEDIEVTGPTRGGNGDDEVAKAPLMIQGNHGPVAIRKLIVKPANFE